MKRLRRGHSPSSSDVAVYRPSRATVRRRYGNPFWPSPFRVGGGFFSVRADGHSFVYICVFGSWAFGNLLRAEAGFKFRMRFVYVYEIAFVTRHKVDIVDTEARMVFLVGHPAKYCPPSIVCAVCVVM